MSSRGQVGIVAMLGVMIVLIALAPILLNIVSSVLGGFSDSIDNIDPNAGAKMDAGVDKFTNLWDYVIMTIFAINVLLLFISAFFIDTNPIFVVLYIFVGFLMFMFAPYVVDVADAIWDTPRYITDGTINELSMTGFLLDNFTAVLLALFILTGIIMYAKIKFFSNEYA